MNAETHYASSSHEPSLEPTPTRRVDLGNHSVLYSLPERPKLRDVPEDQNHKGPVKNFGELITADHKVLSEGCASRNNRRYAVMVQDLAHSMDSILSVQNQDFSGNRQELAKVLGAEKEAQSHLY